MRIQDKLLIALGIFISGALQAEEVQLEVPLPPRTVQVRILKAVQAIPIGQEAHRRYRMALPFGAPLFPPDQDIALSQPSSHTPLSLWLSTPPKDRQHDIFIAPDVDYFWEAEGQQYSCQFLIHVQSDIQGNSQILAFQLRPIAYRGKKFDLLGRTGPGFYLDLRPSKPSPSTGLALRSFLVAVLSGPRRADDRE